MIPFGRALLIMLILAAPGFVFAAEHKITMEGWVFHPAEIVISSGDKITWFNDDDTMHNIFFEDEALKGPSKEDPHKIRVGKAFSFDFTKPGEYVYHCKNHKDYSMSGKIIVK